MQIASVWLYKPSGRWRSLPIQQVTKKRFETLGDGGE
jgi:hypothetical protein